MILHRPLGNFDTCDLFPIEFVGISTTFWHIYIRKENILVKRTSLNHFIEWAPGVLAKYCLPTFLMACENFFPAKSKLISTLPTPFLGPQLCLGGS